LGSDASTCISLGRIKLIRVNAHGGAERGWVKTWLGKRRQAAAEESSGFTKVKGV
jgi:hypothetical protein